MQHLLPLIPDSLSSSWLAPLFTHVWFFMDQDMDRELDIEHHQPWPNVIVLHPVSGVHYVFILNNSISSHARNPPVLVLSFCQFFVVLFPLLAGNRDYGAA